MVTAVIAAIPLFESLLVGAGLVIGVVVTLLLRRHRALEAGPRRILFPYLGDELSMRALDTALRIARVERATLVPVYLVPVPMTMSLEAPIPRVCDRAFDLEEAIEQRAAAAEIPVDGRIARGRTVRHALRQALESERYDRIVVAAGSGGLRSDDIAWLLEHAPAEVVVLRPAAPSLVAA